MQMFAESTGYLTILIIRPGRYNSSGNPMIGHKQISAYTDSYFTKSREAAAADSTNPYAIWQIFQKHNGLFCGVGLLEEILEPADEVWSLEEGAAVNAYETAMLVLARAQSFVEFETVQIGILARCSRVASNVRR